MSSALAIIDPREGFVSVAEVYRLETAGHRIAADGHPIVELPLTKGMVALVSPEDFGWLARWKWSASNDGHGKWYAVRTAGPRRCRKRVYMHRAITDCPGHLIVDHRDGDGLHCWRNNLRTTSQWMNSANCAARGEDKFKGVSRIRGQRPRFRARIGVDYQMTELGVFETEVEAARAYDQAALQAFGEFAWTNFPREQYATFPIEAAPVGTTDGRLADIPF